MYSSDQWNNIKGIRFTECEFSARRVDSNTEIYSKSSNSNEAKYECGSPAVVFFGPCEYSSDYHCEAYGAANRAKHHDDPVGT